MSELKNQAAQLMRQTLAHLSDGPYEAEEYLDDGSPLRVCITITGDQAAFDFTGCATTHVGNLNATPAVVRSVIAYVLRLLINQPIPLNEGMMEPITIILPENSILNPTFYNDPKLSPAVVGGNVETSQRLVDTLIKALGLSACSQGTMNNVLFGNDDFGYYETVAGGAGAGPRGAGGRERRSNARRRGSRGGRPAPAGARRAKFQKSSPPNPAGRRHPRPRPPRCGSPARWPRPARAPVPEADSHERSSPVTIERRPLSRSLPCSRDTLQSSS